jgi:phage tail sheath protein FI
MTFVATNKTPGVYIDEVQLPGPIPGVGTSTAAFIGPARRGPINTPTFLTNWTQFKAAFGTNDPTDPTDPYIPSPPVYVTHAVRGFFDNGGSLCYFVRVSTAVRAWWRLLDRAGAPQPTLVVTAKNEGVAGNNITVQVQDASIASATALQEEGTQTAPSTNNTVTVSAADAAKFKPGDVVHLQGAASERAMIDHISGGGVITFTANLTNAYVVNDKIRLDDLNVGDKVLRVDKSTGIEPGSYVSITQDATTESGVVNAVDPLNNFITLAAALKNKYTLAIGDKPVAIKTAEFTLVIKPPNAAAENYTNLSMDSRHSRYFGVNVNSPTVDVALASPPSTSVPPSNLPAVLAATNLAHGQDDNLAAIGVTEYLNALTALEKVDDANIVCIPDRTDSTVQSALIKHCEKKQDRFAILDPQRNADPNAILAQRTGLTSDRGYAALYYPWISIASPFDGTPYLVPPSGHIAGVYAATDNDRGVHKAPANVTIADVIGLERLLTDDENGPLNENSVNAIRFFKGRGFRVWGARTIATGTQWRYVNVRRLLLFIEKSIQAGTAFAVFEPNDIALWATLKRQLRDFLTRVWQDGALFGASPDDAFIIRVDEELNPPSVRALGQVIVQVTLFPTTPAEFVVFRIIQQPGGPTVQE